MNLDAIKPYAKAVMAGVVAAAGAVATGYADEVLSQGEIWMAVSAGLTAAGATWVIPNAAKAARRAKPAGQIADDLEDAETFDRNLAAGQSVTLNFDRNGNDAMADDLDHPSGAEDYQP